MASPLGVYQVRLKNQSGIVVAIFDNWVKLDYTNEVNGVSQYQFTISGDDTRIPLFVLDGQFEVWRSIPGMNVDWYKDFEGFHRKAERMTATDGQRLFVSTGLGYCDLLARTLIAYKEGTIASEKSNYATRVMKEYVIENCTTGGSYATVVGRLNYDEHLNDDHGGLVYDNVFPGFSVESLSSEGPLWQGERAFENLFSTLQDIANSTGVDFDVVGTGPAQFEFRTYTNGLGIDRRYVDVNPNTGLNPAGNVPCLFSVPFGTVMAITYTNDRLKEANACLVLGKGEVSTRNVYTVANPQSIALSPWNRREISRPGSNQDFDYQFRQLGYEALKENAGKEFMEFDPLQTDFKCYGLHYNLGDKVSASYDEILLHKKLTKVQVTDDASAEKINITFSDMQ